jgi:hypothetical protein
MGSTPWIGGPILLIVAFILLVAGRRFNRTRNLQECLAEYKVARRDYELVMRLYLNIHKSSWIIACRKLAVNGKNPILQDLLWFQPEQITFEELRGARELEVPEERARELFLVCKEGLTKIYEQAKLNLELANSFFPDPAEEPEPADVTTDAEQSR